MRQTKILYFELKTQLEQGNMVDRNKFSSSYCNKDEHKIIKFVLWCRDYDITEYKIEDILNEKTLIQENIEKSESLEIYAYLEDDSLVLIHQFTI
ncbi:hypothetical protein ACI513_03740 [Chryseobacterium sp. M5]|uniref:hypothetical protein n=1 Tax=Chryseobacterium sp. M5 TaxID=3379128 RepID=UPI0038575C34